MADTVTHLAIADKLYDLLGDGVIKNVPLFFGGNIAPDAIHAKKDYQREDKKRSHLCEGIGSFGYGYPEIAQLFKDRVNAFIHNYYMTAQGDRDLYLGYIVHLLTDEFYLLSAYEKLENRLRSGGANPDEPGFRKNLADEVNNGVHSAFFNENASNISISVNEYNFKQNIPNVLEAAWDYEIRDFISANEINISKRRVIKKFIKNEAGQGIKANNNLENVLKIIVLASENIVSQLSDKL